MKKAFLFEGNWESVSPFLYNIQKHPDFSRRPEKNFSDPLPWEIVCVPPFTFIISKTTSVFRVVPCFFSIFILDD